VSEPIPSYHERLEEVGAQLTDPGPGGVLVVDASALAPHEYQ
jgi:hypothetical protein